LFGYIKPCKPEMLVKELGMYKNLYCSLCKNLGKSFGITSRLFLNYDCTFLVVLAISLNKNTIKFNSSLKPSCRCPVNIFKKFHYLKGFEKEFKYASAISIILFYNKLKDDSRDSGIFRKILSKILLFFIKFNYKKAKKAYPFIANSIKKSIKKQENLEKINKEYNVDKSAEPTAEILSEIFKYISQDEKEKRILSQLGYFLGKWVYLLDAADDIKKDRKNNSFNIFNIIYKNKSEEEIKSSCKETLNQLLFHIILSYNLLEVNNFKNILDNIIKLGLKAEQERVLFLQQEGDLK